MSDTQSTVSAGAPTRARLLRDPAALILLAANLVPLGGVLFWGWDAFVLLVLYWLETAVIGFWTLARIATAPAESLGSVGDESGPTITSPLGLSLFFIAHAGIFMGVHFAFLWSLFSGDWAGKVHGPVSFVDKLVLETGLWLPLLVLFIARGVVFFYALIGARVLARLNRWRGRTTASPAAAPPAALLGNVLGSFYARIVVMHLAIIAGAFLSFFGTIAPLIVLIVIKTAIDLGMHAFFELGDADKTFRALLRARERSVRQRAES
jgi:hypothetical protein